MGLVEAALVDLALVEFALVEIKAAVHPYFALAEGADGELLIWGVKSSPPGFN